MTTNELSDEIGPTCAYCTATGWDAWGEVGCGHDERHATVARLIAEICQQPNPTDEQIGWFMDDAEAVVSEGVTTYSVNQSNDGEYGDDFHVWINGVHYWTGPGNEEGDCPLRVYDLCLRCGGKGWLESDPEDSVCSACNGEGRTDESAAS